MITWPDVVKVALLGTGRSTLPLPHDDSPLSQLLAQLNGRSPEQTVLAAAATLALHQQVGTLPPQIPPPRLAPAPDSDWPRCSDKLRPFLAQVVNGRYHNALPELLHALDQNQQRLLEEFIPNLLRHGTRHTPLHPLIRRAIGQRGQWLAAQNENWTYAVATPTFITNPDEVWQTGNHVARLTLLQHLRASNPPQGLALLQTTWASEGPRQRSDFLAALETNLSMADEPFIEAALDDPSYPVRRRALDFLGSLIGSRHCQRQTERAAPLVTLAEEAGRPVLLVELLENVDAALQRDGVLPRATTQGMNTVNWRTAQLLSGVPLTYWNERFGLSAEVLVETAVNSPNQHPLIRGWVIAARRQQNAAWSDALLFGTDIAIATTQSLDLIPLLPPDRQEAFTLHLLEAQQTVKTLNREHPINIALKKISGQWSQSLARAVLVRLVEDVTNDNSGSLLDWKFREAVRQFAYYFPTDLLEEATAALKPVAKSRVWEMRVQEFLDIVQFRRNMLQAIRNR